MLFQSIDKANLYKLKQITFSKTDVSQSESNENPIRAYQKREDLPELYQTRRGMVQISSLLLRIWPPPKKIIGGGPFTIFDAPLNQSC